MEFTLNITSKNTDSLLLTGILKFYTFYDKITGKELDFIFI